MNVKSIKDTYLVKMLIVIMTFILAISPLLASAPYAIADDNSADTYESGDENASSSEASDDSSSVGDNDEDDDARVGESGAEEGQGNDSLVINGVDAEGADTSGTTAGNAEGILDECECAEDCDGLDCGCEQCAGKAAAAAIISPLLSTGQASTTVHANEVNNAAGLTRLGGFTLANNSRQTISNKRVKLEFDTSAYRVTAVNLLAGKEGVRNVVIKTKNSMVGLDKLTPTSTTSYGSATLYFIDLAKLGYGSRSIVSIEYDLGTINSGTATLQSGSSELPYTINYYGDLLADDGMIPTGGGVSKNWYNATMSVGNKIGHTVLALYNQTQSNRVLIVNGAYEPSYVMEKQGSSSSAIKAGESGSLSFAASLDSQRYSNINTGAYRGVSFYMQKHDALDFADISVTQNGQELAADVQDRGNCYEVTAPEAVVGWHSSTGGQLPTVELTVNATAHGNAQAQEVVLSDLFAWSLLDTTANYAYPSNNTTVQDVNGISGHYMIGQPRSGETLQIEEKDIEYAKVGFNTGGASSSIDRLSYEVPVGSRILDHISLPQNPTKQGYTFEGWQYDGGKKLTSASIMPSYDITLVAVWKAQSNSILMSASNFKLSKNEATTYSKAKPATLYEKLIDRGDVKAWLSISNKEEKITGIDIRPAKSGGNKFGSGAGTYYVTYYAGSGNSETSLTVLVSVDGG